MSKDKSSYISRVGKGNVLISHKGQSVCVSERTVVNFKDVPTEFLIASIRSKMDNLLLARDLEGATKLEEEIGKIAIDSRSIRSNLSQRLDKILGEIEDTVDILQRIS